MSLHVGKNWTNVFSNFQYMIVENLGLCVILDEGLRSFLDVLFYLQIALSSLGILGSIVAVVVCVKRKLRSSCSVQLAILSVYDIIFLLACLVIAVLGLKDSWHTTVTELFLCLRTLALWGATYTMLSICAERCLAVVYPFIAHSRFTVGLALKRAGVIVVLGLGFTLPFLLDLINGYSVGQVGQECLHERQLTTFGLVYTLYLSLLLLYLLPFTAIVVINVIFVVNLHRHRQRTVRPKTDTKNATGEEQLSALVLGLSGWYVVTMLLPSLLFLVRLTRLELFEPSVDIRIAAVADMLVVLCFCSNFIFYSLLWQSFRQVLLGWLTYGRAWMCGGCAWVRRITGTYHTGSTTDTSNQTQPVVQIA